LGGDRVMLCYNGGSGTDDEQNDTKRSCGHSAGRADVHEYAFTRIVTPSEILMKYRAIKAEIRELVECVAPGQNLRLSKIQHKSIQNFYRYAAFCNICYRYGTVTTPDFDFENRLFDLINKLSKLLSDYDYEEREPDL